MRKLRLTPKKWLLAIFALIIIALGIPLYFKIKVINEMENAFSPRTHIYYIQQSPSSLQISLSRKVYDLLGHHDSPPPNIGFQYALAFDKYTRALFDGPITEVTLPLFVDFDAEKLGQVLQKMSDLKSIDLTKPQSGARAEQNYDVLMGHISKIASLRRLSLQGDGITDATLSRLNGHPGITTLELNGTSAANCVATLKSLPNLQEVFVEVSDMHPSLNEVEDLIIQLQEQVPSIKISPGMLAQFEGTLLKP